jgi:hypothetical protein
MSYEMFYNGTKKMSPFNTDDCLKEVTTWAGGLYLGTVFGNKYDK